jgi:hypothetical protein
MTTTLQLQHRSYDWHHGYDNAADDNDNEATAMTMTTPWLQQHLCGGDNNNDSAAAMTTTTPTQMTMVMWPQVSYDDDLWFRPFRAD